MAKEIKWSPRAVIERFEILQYWTAHNQSKTYSQKLYKEFQSSLRHIATHPRMGKPTDHPEVYIKIVRNYMIYYRIKPEAILVLAIWDTRRNPEKFKL